MFMSEEDTLKLSRNAKSQRKSPQDEHRKVENIAMSLKAVCCINK